MTRFTSLCKVALAIGAALVLTGCSSTTLRLSGTPGSSFAGRMRSSYSSYEISGTVPFVVKAPGTLQECEFRKTDPATALTLEIRRGKDQILQCTAEPGALGLKAGGNGGWHFEIIR